MIIAHERMSFYAFISILNAFLRLGAILILPFFAMDKLQLYSILILAVSLLMRLLCSIYCKVNLRSANINFIGIRVCSKKWEVLLDGILQEALPIRTLMRDLILY